MRKAQVKKGSDVLCAYCDKPLYLSKQTLRARPEPTCSRDCLTMKNRTKMSPQRRRAALKNNLQKKANLYARLRDCGGRDGGANCISCQKWFSFDDLQGGHFIPTTSSATRFDPRNINAQCRRCNLWLSGNQRHYYKAMVIKYGQEVVDELEAQEFTAKKWSEEELRQTLAYYEVKLKQYT